jgi:hypothetical protein
MSVYLARVLKILELGHPNFQAASFVETWNMCSKKNSEASFKGFFGAITVAK